MKALRFLCNVILLQFLLALAPARAAEPERLPVVASFSILGDITREIGGERIRVTTLVGPDADAHVYRATPADAKALKDAKLVVTNGLGFETFLPRLIRSSGTRAPVVTASTGIRTIEAKPEGQEKPGKAGGHDHDHDHGKLDPHAWQSIDAVRIYVGNIRDGLAKADPAGAETYRANAERYLAALSALKTEIAAGFAAIPREKRVAITNHDAFGYFAREFEIALVSVQGLSTESEPAARDVARVIRLARERKATAIFVENMASPRVAEQIAREAGAKVGGTLFSDALSGENGKAPTYIALMRHNATTMIEAMR